MNKKYRHLISICFPAICTLVFVLLLGGPAASGQTQVEWVMFGLSDGEDETWILVNGDSLRVNMFDFYIEGRNADSDSATLRCTQHTLRRDGVDRTAHAACTVFYLNGGTHQQFARMQGDVFVWENVSGTGKYANIRCEGITRPGVWNAHRSTKGPARWTNHATGTCTTMEE